MLRNTKSNVSVLVSARLTIAVAGNKLQHPDVDSHDKHFALHGEGGGVLPY